MKRIIKNPIFTFVIGIMVSSTTLVVASNLMASNIAYTPKDSTWKVSNVENAIDDLYNKTKNGDYVISRWKSNSAGNAIAYGHLKLPDLTDYKKISIDSLTIESGQVEQIGIVDSNGNLVLSFSISSEKKEYNIELLTGSDYELIAYGSGMSHWSSIIYNNIVMSK